jgi:carboxymethylenebutenolidase
MTGMNMTTSNTPLAPVPAHSPVTTEWLTLHTTDGPMQAYLARPPAGDGPGLLLLQEIFGVNPHIRGVAEQYALAGFTVLAPDLFWRQAPRVELGYVGAERDRAIELMKQLTREQALGDTQVAIDWLRRRGDDGGGSAAIAPRRVGAIGYCMGGRLAYAAAALCGVDRAVAYYGGGIAGQLELAAQIHVPVQFHHDEQDTSIPPEAVQAVQTAMARSPAAAQAEFHLYPGSQHGFNCWSRAAYHPASAALALGRSLEFLSALF